MRWVGTVIAASEKKFVFLEKAFFGFAWIPKATVQAAIGGTTLNTAIALSTKEVRPQVKEQWIEYGKDLISMAVIAVIITAPLGAILTNTLGPKWLHEDKDFDTSPEALKRSMRNLSGGSSPQKKPDIGELNKILNEEEEDEERADMGMEAGESRDNTAKNL